MTNFFSSSLTAQSASKLWSCKTTKLFMNLKPLAEDCATLYTNTGQRSSQVFESLSLPNSAAVYLRASATQVYFLAAFLFSCVALWIFAVARFYCCVIGGGRVVLLLCIIGDGTVIVTDVIFYEGLFGAPFTGGIYVFTTTVENFVQIGVQKSE